MVICKSVFNSLQIYQGFWNHFESKLINVIDKIAPVCKFEDNIVKVTVPGHIKNKLNLRKRLLKKRKNYPSPELKARIANLNFEIRSHFFSITRYKVRKGIIPGNSKTLWQSEQLMEPLAHLFELIYRDKKRLK